MNLLRLSASCHDERSYVLFLQQRHILPANRLCPNGHPMTLTLGDKDRWRCFIRHCCAEKGLRTDNWMQGSRLPFRNVILFIYCWAHALTSVEFVEREIEVEQSAIIDWNHNLREICT